MARYIIGIVSVEEAEAANAAANAFFGDAGNNLSRPYSPTGQEPATHLCGGAWIGDETWAALQAYVAGLGLATLRFLPAIGDDPEALPALARDDVFTEFGLMLITTEAA